MRILFALSMASSIAALSAAVSLAPQDAPCERAARGIRWERSLDYALRRAAREGKPVLFHQLVGDMDKEGC